MKRAENEIMDDFLGLACDLSPENLTCDGELSNKEIQKRLLQIQSSWKSLEDELGKEVTENDVWKWHSKQSKSKNSLKF